LDIYYEAQKESHGVVCEVKKEYGEKHGNKN